jgi:hypothetical protein
MIRSVALLLLLSTWLASSRSSPYHASSGYPFTTTSEAAPAATGDAVSALPAGWEAHVDPSSGNTYFVNVATGETSWDPPVVGVSHAPGSEIPVSCPDDVSSAEEDVSYAAWEDEALGKENGIDNELEREAELGVDVEAAHVQAAAAEAEAIGRSAVAAAAAQFAAAEAAAAAVEEAAAVEAAEAETLAAQEAAAKLAAVAAEEAAAAEAAAAVAAHGRCRSGGDGSLRSGR